MYWIPYECICVSHQRLILLFRCVIIFAYNILVSEACLALFRSIIISTISFKFFWNYSLWTISFGCDIQCTGSFNFQRSINKKSRILLRQEILIYLYYFVLVNYLIQILFTSHHFLWCIVTSTPLFKKVQQNFSFDILQIQSCNLFSCNSFNGKYLNRNF